MAHRNPAVNKKVAIVYNPDKPRARVEWLKLTRWLKARHVVVIGGPRLTRAMREASFIVALGGDGTVLRVARETSNRNIPILGVNVGRLGFLAATEAGATYRTLTRVLAGQVRMESRSMLSVKAVVGGRTLGPFLALNDCVIRSASIGRVLTLHASIRDRLLATYVGDGLIISTPTGSTAYNLAASGPIVHPEVDVFLLSPICPHTLAQRPLVLPTYEVVSVQVGAPSPSSVLSVDGQLNQILTSGDRVEIQRAAEQVSLMMDPDKSFYQVLQSKLKWGGT